MGTSFAVLGYWGLRFGLPVISTVYDLSVAGAHIVRTGSGRGDSNSAGSNLSVLIVGTMALATFRRFWAPGPSRYLDVLWIAGSVIGLPALLFTYARSAVGAVSLGVISLLITAVLAHRSAAQSIRAVVVAVGILAGAIGIFTFVLHESPADYVQTMKSRNEVSQAENGGGFLSGRLAVWQTHLDMLRKYPLAGVPSGTIVAVNAYESATAGTEDWYRVCAHNVFLDFGSNSGLPGLVLFTIVFFRAPIVLVRRRGLGYAGPFVVVLVAIFVAMFNYGASTWKLYWALLALMIYAAGDRQRQYRRPLVIARSGAGKPFRVAA
jgi:O-antigen ligase